MTDLHDKACPSRGAFLAMIDNMRSEGQNSRAEAVTSLLAENERLSARVQHTQQWYAERWQWMQHWFRTTGKDLPIADQFWSIIANGTPDVNTPPTYQQQLNIALHRAEATEARLKALCEAEPVAVIHDDGYWTHPAGQDPFDPYKSNSTRLEVIPRPSMEDKTNG